MRFDMGNIACAQGALYSGCNFFAGYPITPASEVSQFMSEEMAQHGGYFLQMEDEIASLGACVGAVWAGAKAMTATSGPGFSLMTENLSYAIMTETPLVIAYLQRGGPSTGQATLPGQQDVYQARYGAHGDYEIIALCPWSVQEMYDMTVQAFNLSEIYRVPVILLSDAVVGHMREKYELTQLPLIMRERLTGRVNPFGGPMPRFGDGFNLQVTGSAHRDDGVRDYNPKIHSQTLSRLIDKILDHRGDICEVEAFDTHKDKIIVSYGASARPSYGACKELENTGFLRLKTLWPFPDKLVCEHCSGKEVYVVEMNQGKIAREVERAIHKKVFPVCINGGVVPFVSDIVKVVI
jgi:2-oxoglutarate ferredoxin oxidoreductase subunit alpha